MAGVSPISLRLPEDMLDEVQRRSKRSGKSQADWLRDAVKTALAVPEGVPAGQGLPPMPPPGEWLEAGWVAGVLQSVWSSAGAMRVDGEDEIRAWLAAHPVGRSLVAERLATAGLGRTWSGWAAVGR